MGGVVRTASIVLRRLVIKLVLMNMDFYQRMKYWRMPRPIRRLSKLFCLVTSGQGLVGKDFEMALEAYEEMHQTLTIDLCASHGIISQEQFRRLSEAGVKRYHHNIETADAFIQKYAHLTPLRIALIP